MSNPITAALRRKRDRFCPADQSINAPDAWAKPFLQPVSEVPADAVKAAWAPVRLGQSVPMISEEVGYAEPCDPV